MKSVMQHSFQMAPNVSVPRSSFNRSHGYKTTFDAGKLIPIYVDEALPGDTFNCNLSAFARLNTPIFPVMDNMFLDTHFFAVPIRLIWSNFKRFMGEQDPNPGSSTSYIVPEMDETKAPLSTTGWVEGSLADYMGIPTKVTGLVHSALWHRAYNLIWNEWFRDQNLQNSVTVSTGDGPDDPADYVVLRRGKRHDYFTSCLPWPQKNSTAVTIPLGTSAPVLGIGKHNTTYAIAPIANIYESDGTQSTYATAATIDGVDAGRTFYVEQNGVSGYPNIRADLSAATAATINALRTAFQVQRLYERDARGGTRYTELVRSHFGVTSPDARLQRPEYLGGGTSPVNIHPVAQTSSTDVTSPQGNLSGFGTASISGNGFSKSFTEHCIIIGLASVRADLTYQQGLDRMFSRSTRWDFFWPTLAHLGEQSVLNKEIYCDGSANDALTFGYQERYAEYRYKPSKVTGLFRSNATGSLEAWHLSEEFGSLPTLNTTFIQHDPPVDRVVAVNTAPDFKFDAYFNLICVRPMPTYSIPGLIDHF